MPTEETDDFQTAWHYEYLLFELAYRIKTLTLLYHHIWHTYLTREIAVCQHAEDTRYRQAEATVHQNVMV